MIWLWNFVYRIDQQLTFFLIYFIFTMFKLNMATSFIVYAPESQPNTIYKFWKMFVFKRIFGVEQKKYLGPSRIVMLSGLSWWLFKSQSCLFNHLSSLCFLKFYSKIILKNLRLALSAQIIIIMHEWRQTCIMYGGHAELHVF